MASTNPVAGAAERVSGKVGWVETSMMYAWSPTQRTVSGATVVISDGLGLFAPVTVLTDSAGVYSGTFTVPDTGGRTDAIMASASDPGYDGSTSSIPITVSIQGLSGTNPPNATASASTTSAGSLASTSGPGAAPANGQPSTSSTPTSGTASTGGGPPVLSAREGMLLGAVGFVVALFVVFRVATARKDRTG